MRVSAAAAVCMAQLAAAAPITYQGVLRDAGGPANGFYDFTFALYDDASPGAPDTLIASTSASGVAVVDGRFTASLNYPDAAFTGAPRYLQIAVRPFGAGAYTTLGQRQLVADAPAARRANVAAELDLPYFDSADDGPGNFAIFSMNNTSDAGSAISGEGPTWGLIGYGGDYGGFPATQVGTGVWGIGENVGTAGTSGDGLGVLGISTTSTAGLFEINNTSNGNAALVGRTASTTGGAFAVHGLVESASPGGNSTGVRGENRGTGGLGIGVWGSQAGSGWGVYGTAGAGGRAIFGSAPSSGHAGYFAGNVHVTGTLSKAAGSFKIDHPLDPANKYLSHSFVESPEMMNVYSGTATLDADGRAEVTLPDYFEALNTDFRYQLTCIGAHAPVYIARKVSANTFAIAGGTPGLEVSWQVTGTRHDAYARHNPIPVEADKAPEDRGRYLNPEAFGKPMSDAIGYQPVN